jgi:hypothetical protein
VEQALSVTSTVGVGTEHKTEGDLMNRVGLINAAPALLGHEQTLPFECRAPVVHGWSLASSSASVGIAAILQ